ncbi:MAG: hypothetical protein FJ104_11345 [Deltaproteobacteria bacterium]|nr:hypothetical protein [Deltaproteobacteria bacterium]
MAERVLVHLKDGHAIKVFIDRAERDASDPSRDWACWFTVGRSHREWFATVRSASTAFRR